MSSQEGGRLDIALKLPQRIHVVQDLARSLPKDTFLNRISIVERLNICFVEFPGEK